MYIDIIANDNVDEPTMATFKETGASRAIRAVKLWRDARWQWCRVTGWEDGAPAPALVTPIEESGDGPALLIHGGDQGLRLMLDARAETAWSLADAAQWGEPFLICRPDTELVLVAESGKAPKN